MIETMKFSEILCSVMIEFISPQWIQLLAQAELKSPEVRQFPKSNNFMAPNNLNSIVSFQFLQSFPLMKI